MSAEKKKQLGVLGLIVGLIVVLMGSLLFVGAVAGWFDEAKVVVSPEYLCDNGCDEFMTLEVNGYEELLKGRKSFVILVDQEGCTTADRLREFVKNWAVGAGVKVYKMMFAEVKESSLHEYVKYYPSVVVIDEGRVRAWLKADADEDADMYNDYNAFSGWMKRFL